MGETHHAQSAGSARLLSLCSRLLCWAAPPTPSCRYGYTETIDQGPAFVEGALRTLLRQLFDALHISVQQSQELSARHPSLAIGDPPQSPAAPEAISASRPSGDAASVQPMVGNVTLPAGSPAGSTSSSPAKAPTVHALQIAEGAHPAWSHVLVAGRAVFRGPVTPTQRHGNRVTQTA